MRTVVLTTYDERPHVEHPSCWCKPKLVECTCDANCGSVLGHNRLVISEDSQPRISAYSEQYQRGMAPHSA